MLLRRASPAVWRRGVPVGLSPRRHCEPGAYRLHRGALRDERPHRLAHDRRPCDAAVLGKSTQGCRCRDAGPSVGSGDPKAPKLWRTGGTTAAQTTCLQMVTPDGFASSRPSSSRWASPRRWTCTTRVPAERTRARLFTAGGPHARQDGTCMAPISGDLPGLTGKGRNQRGQEGYTPFVPGLVASVFRSRAGGGPEQVGTPSPYPRTCRAHDHPKRNRVR